MKRYQKHTATIIILGLLLLNFSPLLTLSARADVTGGSWAAATAGWAHFAKYVLKEFILDLAARLVARLQLNGALTGIANQVIQSGRTGRSPAFIQNWRNFITESEYRGEDVFRSILRNTAQCPYFRNDILNAFGAKNTSPLTQNTRTGNLDPFTLRGKCTLPQGWSIDNYKRDFSGNGGWNALMRLTQPQNNFYGSFLLSLSEVAYQRNLDSFSDISEGTSGAGFTGTRKSKTTNNSCDTPPAGQCTTAGGSIGSGISCTSDSECLAKGWTACTGGGPSQARCTFLGNVTTPSKILGDAGSEFIDSNLKWLTTSDEISEILGNFIQTMIGRLVDYTAKEIVPGQLADPQKDKYNACITQCNNYSGGSQYALCIDNCSRQVGVDLPPSYDSFAPPNPVPPPGPPPPPPPGPPPSTNQVQLCSAINYGGVCETFNNLQDDPYLNDNLIGANVVSSIRVGGATFQPIVLCPDRAFGGACEQFTGDDPDLQDNGSIHDDAESIRFDNYPLPPSPSCGDLRGNYCSGVNSCPAGYFSLGSSSDCSTCCITDGNYTPPTECSDGIDNDSDSFIDYPNDPDCVDSSDSNEGF